MGRKIKNGAQPSMDDDQDKKQLASVKQHWHLPKAAPKLAIASFILILLMLLAGSLYTYYSDRQVVIDPQKSSSAAGASSYTEAQPTKPAPNAQEGVALDTLTTPVSWGSPVTLQVSTDPTSKCTVSLLVNNIPNPFLGLEPATANSFGNVSWTWTLKDTTPIGTWPLEIVCLYNGKTAVLEENLTITAPSS